MADYNHEANEIILVFLNDENCYRSMVSLFEKLDMHAKAYVSTDEAAVLATFSMAIAVAKTWNYDFSIENIDWSDLSELLTEQYESWLTENSL